jgi:hypothetical protein
MKTKILLSILLTLIVGMQTVCAQGFKTPSPGKAVVYFVPESKRGVASFKYFLGDKYIGVFKGKNYMRYECNPGQNLFWISSENKEFIIADLMEGGTYIVSVSVEMGWATARVSAFPVTTKSTDLFELAKTMINSKPPVITPDEKIKEENVLLAGFIKEKLAMYENEWKNTKAYPHITPEMAIPESSMK